MDAHGGSWKTKRIGVGFLHTPIWNVYGLYNGNIWIYCILYMGYMIIHHHRTCWKTHESMNPLYIPTNGVDDGWWLSINMGNLPKVLIMEHMRVSMIAPYINGLHIVFHVELIMFQGLFPTVLHRNRSGLMRWKFPSKLLWFLLSFWCFSCVSLISFVPMVIPWTQKKHDLKKCLSYPLDSKTIINRLGQHPSIFSSCLAAGHFPQAAGVGGRPPYGSKRP
jgi:hypothetical protein